MNSLPIDQPAQALLAMYGQLVRQFNESDEPCRLRLTLEVLDATGNADGHARYLAERYEQ